MKENENSKWVLKREVNLAMILNMVMIAVLLIGSWFDLQSKLCIVEHDMAVVRNQQEKLTEKMELFHSKIIAWDCRLSELEKQN